MATVRLILYNRFTEAEIARKPIEGNTFLDAAVRAAVIGLEAGALFNVFEGDGHPLRAYWTGHLREEKLSADAVRGILSDKFVRERWGVDACAHCGAPVDGSCFMQTDAGKFCDLCSGIAEALGIGARNPQIMLYEGRAGSGIIGGLPSAVSWTGQIMGYVYGKTVPRRHRFASVRYRVRMLDGSRWHGHGPTAHGNYIRLRPMKGE